MIARRAAGGLVALVAVAAAAACGKAGAPRPPEPRGPLPPALVEARQVGSAIDVAFTVPKSRGPKPAQAPAVAELLRVSYAPGIRPPVDPDAFRIRGEIVSRAEGDPLTPGARMHLTDGRLSELSKGGEGWTLRYAVRVRDRRGRPSPLVSAADLPLAAVAPAPEGVAAEPTADGIRVRWRVAAGDARRFNVYRAPDPGPFDEKPLNAQPLGGGEYLDATAETGHRYRYVTRRLLAEGAPPRESASSSEVSVTAVDLFPPAAPAGLVAVQEASAVRLFWNPSAERDLAGYRVYRREGDGAWSRLGPDPVGESNWLDRSVAAGGKVAYRVTAVDRAQPPNESAPSEEVVVDVTRDPMVPGGP